MPHQTSKRVAIVGSGVSGIGALYALRNTPHDVHIFDAANRLGGHTNTCTFTTSDGKQCPVDTGFIVFNTATYPNFINFLKSLDVKAVETEMTFGVTRDGGAFEWSGTSLSAVFAQRRNILNPRVWRMLFDIIRFNQFALDLLWLEEENEQDPVTGEATNGHAANGAAKHTPSPKPSAKDQESIGAYLERQGYSAAFRDDYLIPMTAAVWSTDPDKCALDFPAITLVRFMWNHHLLTTVATRPAWMTIHGGSQRYIDAVMKDVPSAAVHLGRAVRAVANTPRGAVKLTFADGATEEFDHVILACHGDQAADMLRAGGDATPDELAILANFKTTANTAVLHSDLSLMPRRRLAWAAWNYLTLSSPDPSATAPSPSPSPISRVSLTYNMNILQHLPTAEYGDVLVTLNPLHPPAAASVRGTYHYTHPLYTAAAVRAQAALPRIQNTRGLSYAGAWTKYGFHEDGFSSGVRVACEALGGEVGWRFVDSTFSRGRRPVLGLADYAVRGCVEYVRWMAWAVALWWALVTLPWRLVGGHAAGRRREKVA